MNTKNMLAVVAAFAATAVLAAGPWYVAKEDPNAADTLEEGRGTEALPFRTIQAALDNPAFEALDTVYVKPGVYNEGMKLDNFYKGSMSTRMTNRVFITKAVHLKAVGKKADTVIAGHLSPLDARDGCGTDSIRCIGIAAAAKGTTIEGFTFRDGRSTNTSSSDRAYRKGGGIYYDGTDKGVTVVDCDFIDCRAVYGGAACRVVAIRCLADSCYGKNGIFDGCLLFSCVVVNCNRLTDTTNSGDAIIAASDGDAIVVNCTLLINKTIGLFQAAGKFGENSFEVYNCVLAGNEVKYITAEADNGAAVSNSTKTDTSAEGRYQVFAPALGDYRLVANATAIGLGLASWTNRLVEAGVDPKYLTRDFLGAEIVPDADGKVNAGAVQAVAEPTASTYLRFTSAAYVDDTRAPANGWIASETWPVQYKIRPIVPEGKTFYSYYHTKINNNADIKHHYLQTNGVVYIVPPPATAASSKDIDAKYAAAEIWVDPSSAGSDENGDGSAQAPYKTLQKAVDVATNDHTIIHARRGDYDAGGRAVSNLLSRVDFTGDTTLHVLLRAEEGPDVTAIVGASDSSTLSDSGEPGCGANAVRCVRLARYNAIQGFTLKGGRTLDRNSESVAGGSSTSDLVKDGAAVYGREINNYESGQILDCVVTNCIGVNSIMHNVHISRCRIVGCTAREFVVNKGSCASSVVHGNVCQGYLANKAGSYMSTYVGNSKHPAQSEFINWGANCTPCYSVFVGGSVGRKSASDFGNYVWNQTATDNLSENSTVADPLLVDIANGDLRPFAFSPVVHGAAAEGAFYKYVTSDFNGGPPAISADGRLSVGAFHNSLPSAFVQTAKDGSAVTNVLEIGSTGTLTFPANREGVAPWWKGTVDLHEGELEIAWVAKGSPCSFAATVSGEGTLTATLDGDALGSVVAADGTKTFEFMNDGQAVRTLKLSFAGRGSVRLSDFCNHMGFIMVVR